MATSAVPSAVPSVSSSSSSVENLVVTKGTWEYSITSYRCLVKSLWRSFHVLGPEDLSRYKVFVDLSQRENRVSKTHVSLRSSV